VLAAAEGVARLLGTRPPEEMPAAYADAEVFCLPSWWEAMPLSVLEAMAAGLPVVASAVGGLPEMVSDGETGFLVAPGDAAGLGDALARLVADPALRARMGAAGRRRARERFDLPGFAAAHLALYQRELGDGVTCHSSARP
jgi:glycosyltransferase involved in cell wall biosynthesis